MLFYKPYLTWAFFDLSVMGEGQESLKIFDKTNLEYFHSFNVKLILPM